MKNWAIIGCLSFFLLGFSSCFEVTEEVNMNADGSGKMSLTINLSESRQNLVQYMKVGSVDGMYVPNRSQIDDKLDAILYALQGIKGLSNAQIRRDFDNFIFVCTSEFSNIGVLNEAINAITDLLNEGSYPTIRAAHFDYSKKQFARHFQYPLDPDWYNNASLSARYVMDSARMISIFRLPEPVKKISNQKALLSPSKKSVMLQASIADLARGLVKLDNTISF